MRTVLLPLLVLSACFADPPSVDETEPNDTFAPLDESESDDNASVSSAGPTGPDSGDESSDSSDSGDESSDTSPDDSTGANEDSSSGGDTGTAESDSGESSTGEPCTPGDEIGCDCVDSWCSAGLVCDTFVNKCVEQPCGNGVLDPTEQCDGDLFGGAQCEDFPSLVDHGPPFVGGDLQCTAQCQLNFDSCERPPAVCNDGWFDPYSEACDAGEIGPYTCQDFGFGGGSLGCNDADCTLNLDLCT